MSLAEPALAQSNYEQALAISEREMAWLEVGGLCHLLAENQSYLGDDQKAWSFLHRGLEIAVTEGESCIATFAQRTFYCRVEDPPD